MMGRFVRVMALAGLIGLVAACGGGSGSNAKTASGSTTRASTGSIQGSSSTLAQASRPIGKTVWFDGFKVTVDTAALTPAVGGGQGGLLTLQTTFENLGNDPAQFGGQASVNSHGQDFPSNSSGTTPNVPGAGKGKGTILFDVDNTVTLDDAVVTFGKPDETKAKVPLGTNGSLVALAPLAVTGLSAASAGQVKFDLKSGEARADKTQQHGQAASGHWYVYISGTLSFSGSASGTNVGPEDVAVKLPDGSSVAGEAADSKSCCFAVYPGQLPDFSFRFLVGDPPSGSYTGTVTSKVGGNNVTAPFSFQVAAAPAGGTTTTTTGGTGSTTTSTAAGATTPST